MSRRNQYYSYSILEMFISVIVHITKVQQIHYQVIIPRLDFSAGDYQTFGPQEAWKMHLKRKSDHFAPPYYIKMLSHLYLYFCSIVSYVVGALQVYLMILLLYITRSESRFSSSIGVS